jgi:hypothetical protein
VQTPERHLLVCFKIKDSICCMLISMLINKRLCEWSRKCLNSSMYKIYKSNKHHLYGKNVILSYFFKKYLFSLCQSFQQLPPNVTILRNDKTKCIIRKKIPKDTLLLLCRLTLCRSNLNPYCLGRKAAFFSVGI